MPFSAAALDYLVSRDWPGGLREFNIIVAVVGCEGDQLLLELERQFVQPISPETATLDVGSEGTLLFTRRLDAAMRSLTFLAALSMAAVACSAEATGDSTGSAETSQIPDGAARATTAPGPITDAGSDVAESRSYDGGRSSAESQSYDARRSSSDGEAGPRVQGDAEADVSLKIDAGAAGYDPCPAPGTPCTVMPLGDSITFGVDATLGYNMSNGGYRIHLFDLTHRSGKVLTYVGSQSNGPDAVDGVPFPKANEGHPGWVIVQISDIIVNAMQTYKPNIITLMIGTNDINADFDPPGAPNRFGSLVDTILATDPKVLLVVAKIVPTQSSSENVEVQAYNSAIGDLVAARIKAGKHLALVDMYTALTSSQATKYLSDNLHPNDAGYALMAQTWFSSIGPLLH